MIAFVPLVAIMFFFCSCQSPHSVPKKIDMTPHQALAQSQQEIQSMMKAKYGLSINSSGLGSLEGRVDHINIGFEGIYCVDQEVARRMLVNAVTDILVIINSHPEMRPILYNYPFTPDNLAVILFFCEDNDEIAKEPCVATVGDTLGTVSFHYKSRGQLIGYSRIEEEPYEEALAKVRGGNENG